MKRNNIYNMFGSILAVLLCCPLVKAGTPPTMIKDPARSAAAYAYADSVMQGMTDEQLLAQLIMPMVYPKEGQKALEEWDHLVARGFGGVLWQKGTPERQLFLTNRMRQRATIPMLVAMDGEWGLSMRLSGTIRWPRTIVLGATNNLSTAFEYGRATAEEAKRMGIQVNFAPVADVNNNPLNPVIGTRSFGSGPQQVAKLVLAYGQGLESLGVLAVAKHFPGHGDTKVDSHKALPVISHDRARLEEVELYPFTQFIQKGLGGIMTGHLTVPALDNSRKAASVSHVITTELLQEQLGFEGLIFTDGLAMQGVIDNVGKGSVAVATFKAGNDILLAPPSPQRALAELLTALKAGEIDRSEVLRRCRKVLAWKHLLGATDRTPLPTTSLSADLNNEQSKALRTRIYEESVTLLKNNESLLPFAGKSEIALLRYGDSRTAQLLQVLRNGGTVSSHGIGVKAGSGERQATYQKLRKSSVILVAITSERARPDAGLLQLARDRSVVMLFLTNPYTALHFKEVITEAKAVVMGYDSSVDAQTAVGRALLGQLPMSGVLPVDLPPLFKAGAGIPLERKGLTFAKPEAVGLNSRLLSKIDDIALEGVKKGAYPGCQVLVAKEGKVVYSKAFGYKDSGKKEPNNTATLYDLASVTKAVATVPLLMMAEDEGRLSTKDPLGKHLNFLKGSNKESVTLADLLFHTGGMPAVINFYLSLIDQESYPSPLITYRRQAGFPIQIARKAWARRDFSFLPSLVSREQSEDYPIRFAEGYYLHRSVREMMREEIRDAQLRRRGYRYSDIDFLLLQEVLEQCYQLPLDQLFMEKLATPLGLKRLTYCPLARFAPSEIAEGQNDQFLRHQTLRGDVDDEAAAMLGGVSGNAGLFGSAEELFPLLQMLLNGGTYDGHRYIKPNTVQKFTTARRPGSPYALGFDRHRGKGKVGNVADIAPLSTYGHTGFTGTCCWVDPQNEIVYIFLSNRGAPKRWNNQLSQLHIRTRIQEQIYLSLRG